MAATTRRKKLSFRVQSQLFVVNLKNKCNLICSLLCFGCCFVLDMYTRGIRRGLHFSGCKKKGGKKKGIIEPKGRAWNEQASEE